MARVVAPEKVAWRAMRQRCYYAKFKQYADYGGRGIIVCERWKDSFENFLEDMGPKPSPQHSLDRKDTDGNYTPENCRWATKLEQAQNARSNVLLTFQGKTQTISAWAKEIGMNYDTLKFRIQLGWPVEEALTKPTTVKTWKKRS